MIPRSVISYFVRCLIWIHIWLCVGFFNIVGFWYEKYVYQLPDHLVHVDSLTVLFKLSKHIHIIDFLVMIYFCKFDHNFLLIAYLHDTCTIQL